MLPAKLAFVDIETTGMRAIYDRIIEIGILRVEGSEVTKTFHSLIDPQTHIPSEITFMTGITGRDLENAPTFRQIKEDILEILDGCVFVAHNVRFDYGFIKNEFRRLELSYKAKHFCTVRLSRMLYPQYKHHNLDSLIERFGFSCEKRHRAFDDAKILFSFYQKVLQDFPIEKIVKAINIGVKKPNIPVNLKTNINNIPEKPGVYIFYGKSGLPLYIGKSINLRDRILSHFSSDINSPLEMKITQQIESIETIQTAGELGALILESQLIKNFLPLYNRKSRIKHELIIIKSKINNHGYNETYLDLFKPDIIKNNKTIQQYSSNYLNSILGFCRSRKQAKNFLAATAKKFNLCEKLLGLESAGWRTNSACFAYRLGQCKGACIGKEKPIIYNLKFITAFSSTKIKSWPFSGPITIVETDGYIKEYFIIDQWCYLENIKIDSEGNKNNQPILHPSFDLDIYNILLRYLSKPQNYKNLKIST